MQLHNKKHIDEDERRRKQHGVETVQHTAVSGDQISRILDARGAFEHRLHQIAQHARCGRHQRQTEPRPYIGIEAREGGGPAEYFDWAKDLVAGTIERRLREHFTVAGYIFFLNCEQAQRYNILLYSSIAPEDVAPMGIKAFSDVNALLDAAQLEGKSIYVIPNGSTVIPHVKEASKHEA